MTAPARATPGPGPGPGAAPAPGFRFSTYKREIGAVAGILVALIVMFTPIGGLSVPGRQALAISLFGVIWWAMGVVQPGYTSLLMLVAWIVLKVAPPETVLSLWTSPLMYLVIGGYLIAAAVQDSGLGKRISYMFIIKFVNSFSSIIISSYVLGFLLSFLIPHPWPRSFLIMSVMAMIIKSANLPKRDAAAIGLAVFAGSASNSMILLTGDSVLNMVGATAGNVSLSWLEWAKYMAVPGIVASALTCLLQLKLFKPSVQLTVDKHSIRHELNNLGSMTGVEKRTLLWVALAVVLWATDSVHHIHPGWIAALMAIALALPRVGNVLKPTSWSAVPVGTLLFLSASSAIGKVGGVTGMNKWVASVVLPSNVPSNIFLFAAIAVAVTVVIHMVLGSALAVMGIATPALILFANAAGINPIVASLLAYTAVSMHFILPFHHMNVLVGVGDNAGGYGDAEVIKFGIPLTVLVFVVTVLVEIPWWKLTGLL
jgi:di/tricarboxylate transporter